MPRAASATVRSRLELKLRLFILVVLGVLIFVADAAASVELQTVSRKGVKTTSRQAKFDCGFRANHFGLDDLLLRCSGPEGFAKAKYDFYLPKNLYGTPTMHVYGKKLCCSSSVVKRTLVHVDGRHYRIVVRVNRRVRFDVRSVSLSYYVRT
jgi:hypothetical protein